HGATTRWPTINVSQLKDAVSAAHAAQALAVVHVSRQEDARSAIEANADGLVHIFLDTIADDSFVRTTRQRGAFVVATLSVIASEAQAGEGRKLASDERL